MSMGRIRLRSNLGPARCDASARERHPPLPATGFAPFGSRSSPHSPLWSQRPSMDRNHRLAAMRFFTSRICDAAPAHYSTWSGPTLALPAQFPVGLELSDGLRIGVPIHIDHPRSDPTHSPHGHLQKVLGRERIVFGREEESMVSPVESTALYNSVHCPATPVAQANSAMVNFIDHYPPLAAFRGQLSSVSIQNCGCNTAIPAFIAASHILHRPGEHRDTLRLQVHSSSFLLTL
jgi:hypothetical protein